MTLVIPPADVAVPVTPYLHSRQIAAIADTRSGEGNHDIYAHLDETYAFRRNEVTADIEVRTKTDAERDPNTPWERCEDRHYNTMRVYAKRHVGLPSVTVGEIMGYANSAYTPSYHPIRDYLLGQTWDGEDHIARLAGLVHTEDDAVWTQYLRCWMIRAVAQVLDGTANEYMIVLAGAQGIGKTTFARALVPKGLRDYALFRKIEHGKDGQAELCSQWIIVDDELVGLRKAEVEAIKATLSSTRQTYRPPYGRMTVTRPRIASFIGATNEAEFLVDPTGARRFLAITMLSADLPALRSFNIDGAWTQAVALYRSGELGYLPQEIAMAQAKINERLGEETIHDHYVQQYVEASANREHWANGTTIANRIARAVAEDKGGSYPVSTASVRELGRALRKAGYKQDTHGVKVWKVRVRDRYDLMALARTAVSLVGEPLNARS